MFKRTLALAPALLAALAACPPLPGTGAATAGSTATTGPGTTTGTSSTGTTTTATTTTTSTGAPTTSTTTDPTSGNADSLAFLDTGEDCCWGVFDCDVWTQDCPTGEKCAAYAKHFNDWWDSTTCVPVVPDPDPVGQPCLVVGGIASGMDSCDSGAMCWGVDEMTNEGTCVALCTGSADAPLCPPETSCVLFHGGVLNLCLPTCDPLAQDCPPDRVCIAAPSNPFAFICVDDVSGDGGQLFDPCEYANACDPGLFCTKPAVASECDPKTFGCCTPFCDLGAPNTCPGAMQECLPWYPPGTAPAGLDDLGYCSLP